LGSFYASGYGDDGDMAQNSEFDTALGYFADTEISEDVSLSWLPTAEEKIPNLGQKISDLSLISSPVNDNSLHKVSPDSIPTMPQDQEIAAPKKVEEKLQDTDGEIPDFSFISSPVNDNSDGVSLTITPTVPQDQGIVATKKVEEKLQDTDEEIPDFSLIPSPLDGSTDRVLLTTTSTASQEQGTVATKRTEDVLQDMDEEAAILHKLQNIILPEVEFQEASFLHVLDVLKEMAILHDDPSLASGEKGFNMVVLGNIPNTTVTLRLHNMPLERILRFVVKAVRYQFDIVDGSVVFFSSKEHCDLETRFFPISRGTVIRIMGKILDDTKMPFSPEKPSTIAVEEAYLKNFFQRAGIDFTGTNGSNMVFDGTQLIATHTPLNLRRLRNILQRYHETKQVEIETRFVEINTGNLNELAIQWGFLKGPTSRNNTWNLGTQRAGANNFAPDVRTLAEAFATRGSSLGKGKIVSTDNNGAVHESEIDNSPPSFPNLANFGNNANPLGDFIGVISGGKLNIMLKALEQSTEAEMMCAPKITVLSGKMASITVAQELRYPTSYSETKSDVGSSSDNNSGAGVTITAGRPENFQTRNVGVEMAVIPTVEENGCIDLQLQPTVTEFEGFVEYGGASVAMNNARTVYTPSGFYQPIFSTRQIKTELTIQNGSTVIMGGLMREESKEVKDKVPILGDLPLLGKLFRSRGETTQKKNLLIFVTANILSSDGVPLKAPNVEIFSPQEEQNILLPEVSSVDENRPFYAKTKMPKRHHRH
jgi:general secretion pathway protein D